MPLKPFVKTETEYIKIFHFLKYGKINEGNEPLSRFQKSRFAKKALAFTILNEKLYYNDNDLKKEVIILEKQNEKDELV